MQISVPRERPTGGRRNQRLRLGWLKDGFAVLVSLPLLIVLLVVVVASFTPNRLVNRGVLFRSFTLDNYEQALQSAPFALLYWNTFLYTFGLLAAQLIAVTLAGYALTRLAFKGRETVFYLIFGQLFLPPVALILPNFLLIKQLGLADTLTGIALPYVASATGVFLLRQGFKSVPRQFDDAAHVDGATPLQTLWFVLLPMVRPHLAAFALISVIYHWNEFLWPLIATSSPDKRILAVGLASFTRSAESGAEWGLIAAGSLLVATPLIALFVAFQDFFVKSFSQSGLKG
jgi:sn-glycerol 3-phosphate transport system permease protein